MILSEGVIIATLVTMGFTTLMKWLKDKVIKNQKIKYLIPNGFFLSLIFGLASIPVLMHFKLCEFKDVFWEFLGAWIIIVALSGGAKIAGKNLITFIKAFLSSKQTQIAQAEIELKDLKNQVTSKEEKIDFLVDKINQ